MRAGSAVKWRARVPTATSSQLLEVYPVIIIGQVSRGNRAPLNSRILVTEERPLICEIENNRRQSPPNTQG